MSETQSYKTVTLSPELVEALLFVLDDAEAKQERLVASYEEALWHESAARAQAKLDQLRALYKELSA